MKMIEGELPEPNLSGYPDREDIERLRAHLDHDHVDVSQMSRTCAIQWLNQLLRYIDSHMP